MLCLCNLFLVLFIVLRIIIRLSLLLIFILIYCVANYYQIVFPIHLYPHSLIDFPSSKFEDCCFRMFFCLMSDKKYFGVIFLDIYFSISFKSVSFTIKEKVLIIFSMWPYYRHFLYPILYLAFCLCLLQYKSNMEFFFSYYTTNCFIFIHPI